MFINNTINPVMLIQPLERTLPPQQTTLPDNDTGGDVREDIIVMKEQLKELTRSLEVQQQQQHFSKKVNFGSFTRRDVYAGVLLLEVSEDGTYASLSINNKLIHEMTHVDLNEVGVKHTFDAGVCYILTLTENAILELDNNERKYILKKNI
jgi:hypothetical protein